MVRRWRQSIQVMAASKGNSTASAQENTRGGHGTGAWGVGGEGVAAVICSAGVAWRLSDAACARMEVMATCRTAVEAGVIAGWAGAGVAWAVWLTTTASNPHMSVATTPSQPLGLDANREEDGVARCGMGPC